MEHRINGDTSDADSLATCQCGEPARYAGRRPKTFTSVLGEMTLQRAYFHCAACGSGFFPRDRALGLERMQLTPGVTRMVAAVDASVSFEEGSSLLGGLAGLSLDARQVERAAETLVAEVAADERAHVRSRRPGFAVSRRSGREGLALQ